MIKASVIGATGYAGAVLTGILSSHKEVEIKHLQSHSYSSSLFSDIYPGMKHFCDKVLEDDDIEKAAEDSDVIFLALPAAIASKIVTGDILKKCKVIDLGADFRLHDRSVYESWYKVENKSEYLDQAVYGLCEIHRDEIKKASLIANPGCYTTCSILTLYPLLKAGLIENSGIIIDAKSGVSGAGRSEKLTSLYSEVDESIKPYGVKGHRHTPEIEQELGLAAGSDITLDFVPHLVPMQRGILSTCYAKLKKGVDRNAVDQAYSIYRNEKFIRLVDYEPQTRFVKNSNLCDIYTHINERTGNIIAIGALDNLVKGAAGQAVQNMNILFSLDEGEGLNAYSSCPM